MQQLQITSPRVNSAEANELRVCASTNRLMYLVQFELERNWWVFALLCFENL